MDHHPETQQMQRHVHHHQQSQLPLHHHHPQHHVHQIQPQQQQQQQAHHIHHHPQHPSVVQQSQSLLNQQNMLNPIFKSDDSNDDSPMATEQTNDNRSSIRRQNQHSINQDDIMQRLTALVQKTQDTDAMVQSNRDKYQHFVIKFQTRARILTGIGYAENAPQSICEEFNVESARRDLQITETELRHQANELNNIRRQLIKSHCEIFDKLLEIQNKILYEYLPGWHQEQQLINNGVKIETIKLDTIQSWVEKVVEIIWRIKNQIKGLQLTLSDKPNIPFDTEDLEKFVVCVNKALENLILNAFVVEKQPPQVMKTNTRFTATVRFLCGNKLNVQMINPTVKALILSETNARSVIRYHKLLIEESWAPFDNHHSNQLVHHQGQQVHQVGHPVPAYSTMLSPVHQTATPTPQNMTIESQQQQAYCAAHEQQQQQPMALVDHQALRQKQQQFQPPVNQAQAMTINMTTQHQRYRGITEIGYNPDIPMSSKDFENSGEILNNSNILEFQEQTGHMISHFRNMQLKKIKRAEKKGTESVMDEKFVLLFFTEFRVADDSFWPYSYKTTSPSRVKRGDLLFHILAFSLPVVVIVHGNQEPHAWATVTWHNAFATQDAVLYKVPDRVSWRELGHVLSEKFHSCAGRGLSQQNLKYLASKVYRNRVDNDDVLISWNQFSKEPLADRSFTFWEWFHSILKLTREHLRDLWKADRIRGFVGKKGCMDLLLGSAYSEPQQIGTFLLRYSETELGGITIAWVSNSSELSSMNPSLNDRVQISKRLSPTNSSTNVVMHLQPFLAADLKTRSLADRIRDLKDLVYLYPNIPKDEAFKAYYTPITSSINNSSYIKSILVTTIAANYKGTVESNQSSSSSPQTLPAHEQANSITPISGSQCSPEHFYHENNMVINDAMEASYPPYDPMVGDFNYSI